MDDTYGGDFSLGNIFDKAANIFGQWVDYDTKKSLVETQADLQRYQYQMQYRPRSTPVFGTGADGSSLLPILLIGGAALVGVYLIAKA